MKRIIIDVVFDRGQKVWKARPRGTGDERNRYLGIPLYIFTTYHEKKAEAIKYARAKCRRVQEIGKKAQLFVFGKDGRIQYEHTYGDDPVRTKG